MNIDKKENKKDCRHILSKNIIFFHWKSKKWKINNKKIIIIHYLQLNLLYIMLSKKSEWLNRNENKQTEREKILIFFKKWQIKIAEKILPLFTVIFVNNIW